MLVYQKLKKYKITFAKPRFVIDVVEVYTDNIKKTKKEYSNWDYKGHRRVEADDLPVM